MGEERIVGRAGEVSIGFIQDNCKRSIVSRVFDAVQRNGYVIPFCLFLRFVKFRSLAPSRDAKGCLTGEEIGPMVAIEGIELD